MLFEDVGFISVSKQKLDFSSSVDLAFLMSLYLVGNL